MHSGEVIQKNILKGFQTTKKRDLRAVIDGQKVLKSATFATHSDQKVGGSQPARPSSFRCLCFLFLVATRLLLPIHVIVINLFVFSKYFVYEYYCEQVNK